MMGSGTISGPTREGYGSLELTWEENPIKLNDGTERKFINDNDTVIIGSVKMDRYALV
jgi:fumarylacetoacetase